MSYFAKKEKIIRIAAYVLTVIMLAVLTGCGRLPEENVPEETPKAEEDADPYEGSKKYGLHAENGYVYLNGELFYGMGFCWFDGFYLTSSIGYKNQLDRYFAKLEEGGIPFVRVMMGVFSPAQLIRDYKRNKENYYENMDYFVSLAEKHHVGIIASLNWNYTTFAYANNEDISAITDPYSRGNAMLKNYIKEVVTRYNDSPAIWGWEIGNEANLAAELTEYEVDYLPCKLFEVTEYSSMYYEIVSNEIRKYDPYRIITNGDGGYRNAWRSLRNSFGNEWLPDTEEDYRELYKFQGSGSVDTLSVHYPVTETLKTFTDRAREMGYAYYVGEFASLKDVTSGLSDPRQEEAEKGWWEVANAIIEADVQISSHWCWGRYISEKTDTSSVEPGLVTQKDGTVVYQNYFVWENVIKINDDYVKAGKNNSASYWASCENLLFKGE